MITGLSDLESRLKGVEEGVDDFLIKPIDNRELKSRINALLRKKSISRFTSVTPRAGAQFGGYRWTDTAL